MNEEMFKSALHYIGGVSSLTNLPYRDFKIGDMAYITDRNVFAV